MPTRRRKRCPTCCPADQMLPASAFYRNPARADGLSSQCRACHRTVERLYYERNAARERGKHRTRNVRLRRAIRARMVEYLASAACQDCGNANPVVLEFHHKAPRGIDDALVSVLVARGHSWPRIRREIEKCSVLCANCHRMRTAAENGHYRALLVPARARSTDPERAP